MPFDHHQVGFWWKMGEFWTLTSLKDFLHFGPLWISTAKTSEMNSSSKSKWWENYYQKLCIILLCFKMDYLYLNITSSIRASLSPHLIENWLPILRPFEAQKWNFFFMLKKKNCKHACQTLIWEDHRHCWLQFEPHGMIMVVPKFLRVKIINRVCPPPWCY